VSPVTAQLAAATGDPFEVANLDGAFITRTLGEAKSWLTAVAQDTDPAAPAEFRAYAATLAEGARQRGLGRDVQLDAQEIVRRAERGIGVAIRNGQRSGTVAKRGSIGGLPAPGVRGARSGSARHDDLHRPVQFFPSGGGAQTDAYAMADVTDEQFDAALRAAKAEGDLGRANVIRRIKALCEYSGLAFGAHALVVHPAVELFPLIADGPEFDELCADIADKGLRRPIVRTLKGAILDGRRRALACRVTGVAPKYSVHAGNPWRYVVTANDHRFTNNNHRAVIGGMILCDPAAKLSGREAREACGVSSMGSLMRGKAIARSGTPDLIKLTIADQVPLTTAARIAGLSTSAQDTFVAKVEHGAQPRHVGRPGWTGDHSAPDPTAKLSQREARYRYVQETAMQTMANSLESLGIVLNSATGLDPSITPEQAAHWRSDLSRLGKNYRQLMVLLKDRSAAQGE
jgi:hypothetical protein